MLTPAFELSQDEKFVHVYIKTPYIKISEVEYFIEGYQFKFYVKPYFLRLNFPEKIVENGEESASYDVDKDLDLITKLLAPSGRSNIGTPMIEIVSDELASKDQNEDEDKEDFGWEFEQDIYDEKKEFHLSLSGTKYGFGNQISGVFYRLKDELKEIIENPDPDELSFSERHLGRLAAEDGKFDPEYYLADFFDNERIQELLNYVAGKDAPALFTEEEKARLRQLPNREYLMDEKAEMSAFFSLVDITFAFAYNKRTTLGENTKYFISHATENAACHSVESAWTISTLSSTLSWFESKRPKNMFTFTIRYMNGSPDTKKSYQRFTNLKDVIVSCYRRSLSYPLYRHWQLSCKVMQDLKDIFQQGRRKLLQCLLEILTLFNGSEPRYLLNELYITDYCVWIQKVKEKKVKLFTKKLSEINIKKEDIGWELQDLETAAFLVQEDEEATEEPPQLSAESSSSEDSSVSGSESETQTSSEENLDCGTGAELGTSSKACEELPKVSHFLAQCEANDGESSDARLCFCGDKRRERKQIASEDSSSEDETLGNIKILPSLLFRKDSSSGGKTLVEVIEEDGKEMEAKGFSDKSMRNGDIDIIDCNVTNHWVSVANKETDCDVKNAVGEHEISGRILGLSINDTDE